MKIRPIALVMALVTIAAGCQSPDTSQLSADIRAELEADTIVKSAENQTFRYTYYSRSSGGNRWEDRAASIIVTKQRLYIHKNEKVGLDLRGTSRKKNEVRREGDRVIIASGSGQSKVSWSFRPPDDAEGWAAAIRAALGE